MNPDQHIIIYSPNPQANAQLATSILQDFQKRNILTGTYFANDNLPKELNEEHAYSIIIADNHIPSYAELLKANFQIGLIATFTFQPSLQIRESADHYLEPEIKK